MTRAERAAGSLATGLLVLGLLAGCSGDGDAGAPAGGGPTLSSRDAQDSRVDGVLDGVPLVLEVADSPRERARGLMERTSVPAGTGMVFLYDEPVDTRFYMFQVPIPLLAVFVRDGEVVSSVVMPPCDETEPQDCPTYGADGPFDTVVETDPATLPDVQPGDALVLES